MTTTWTDINKPIGTSYSSVPKPLGTSSVIVQHFTGGDPIGLLLSLTYSQVTNSSIVTGIWTDINKPNSLFWSNVPKAT